MRRSAPRLGFACLLPLIAAGCDDFDGEYLPDCAAHAGDRVTIEGTRFSWDRFTDAVRVDDDGNRIDAFPNYPKSGSISAADGKMRFVDDAGEEIAMRHVVVRDGVIALLTEAEHGQWETTGNWPDCPLSTAGS